MSSIPEPSPDPADQRARNIAATSSLVDEFVACRTDKAALDAREIRALAAAAALVEEQRSRLISRESRQTDMPARTMVAELATAAHVSERTVQRQLNDAADLCARFSVLVDALAQGRISRTHVAVIHEAGWPIDHEEARTAFLATAIARAETMTPGRLRPVVEILAARLHPRTIKERCADACAQRGVRVTDLPDGVAALTMTGDAVLAGEGIDAIRAIMQVTVPVSTAAGIGTEPALLAGYGPIDPDTARRLLGNATGWERVLTSPVTGCVLAVDRYRRTSALTRFLRARDERCRFPGCRQPVWRCDVDHTIDAAHGGPTESCNLAHLCRRHHVLKHHSAWAVRQLGNGILEWTSPTGRIYIDQPEPAVRFAPSADPPNWRDPAARPEYDPDHDPAQF